MGSFIDEFKGDNEKKSDIVVTVDGESGAGKGTIADHISKRLRIAHFSASDVFYQIAEDRGISHVELAQQADKQVDLEVDRRTLQRGLENNCVIDSRIASWVLGDHSDLRVYVTADLDERAKRIAGREKIDFEQAKEDTEKRDEENDRRYEEYYGIDTGNLEIYDLVIDNTDMSIGKQNELIDKALKKQFQERYEEQ